jgi:hypothetical protein
MLSERTAFYTPTRLVMTRARHATDGRNHLVGTGGIARRLTHAIIGFAQAPALPYAALWEASLVVSLLNVRDSFESDRPATEMNVLTDVWLRG